MAWCVIVSFKMVIFDAMKTLLTFLFVFTATLLYSQEGQDTVAILHEGQHTKSTINHEEINKQLQKDKLQFNLEFGTSVGGNKYGAYAGTYVSPRITYPVSNRFSLSLGGYFTGITPLNQAENSAGIAYPYGSFLTRSFIYVEGAYRLTENLIVTGAAYKEVDLFNAQRAPVPGYNFDSQGFIMGVDYKIGDHVFIRGQVEVSNGNGSRYRSPFMNPVGGRMHDPFFPGR